MSCGSAAGFFSNWNEIGGGVGSGSGGGEGCEDNEDDDVVVVLVVNQHCLRPLGEVPDLAHALTYNR